MIILFSAFIALMAATSVMLILRGDRWSLVLGLALLGGATNCVLFFSSGGRTLSAQSADPLPQALILTAIVISMAVVAWLALALTDSNGEGS